MRAEKLVTRVVTAMSPSRREEFLRSPRIGRATAAYILIYVYARTLRVQPRPLLARSRLRSLAITRRRTREGASLGQQKRSRLRTTNVRESRREPGIERYLRSQTWIRREVKTKLVQKKEGEKERLRNGQRSYMTRIISTLWPTTATVERSISRSRRPTGIGGKDQRTACGFLQE